MKTHPLCQINIAGSQHFSKTNCVIEPIFKYTTEEEIGSDNGLSPGRRQAIIWTNAGILLIGPLETNFSEILIGIQTFSFKKMHLKMSSAKWRPFRLGLNVLSQCLSESPLEYHTHQRARYFMVWRYYRVSALSHYPISLHLGIRNILYWF